MTATDSTTVSVFRVLGMGCSSAPRSYIEYLARDHLWNAMNSVSQQTSLVARANIRQNIRKCEVWCHSSMARTFFAVANQCVMRRPKVRHWYVRDRARVIEDALAQDRCVILTGHSYGGYVVCMIVRDLLSRGVDIQNLRALTVGSLYVPKPEEVQGAYLNHVLAVGDIVTRCNGYRSTMKRLQASLTGRSRAYAAPTTARWKAVAKGYVTWFDDGQTGWDAHNSEGYEFYALNFTANYLVRAFDPDAHPVLPNEDLVRELSIACAVGPTNDTAAAPVFEDTSQLSAPDIDDASQLSATSETELGFELEIKKMHEEIDALQKSLELSRKNFIAQRGYDPLSEPPVGTRWARHPILDLKWES